MDIHVAPTMGVQHLGGVFRKPLQAPSQFIIDNVTEGLKKIFEVERSL